MRIRKKRNHPTSETPFTPQNQISMVIDAFHRTRSNEDDMFEDILVFDSSALEEYVAEFALKPIEAPSLDWKFIEYVLEEYNDSLKNQSR